MASQTQKFSGINVTNTIVAKEVWANGFYDKRTKENILVVLDKKIKDIQKMSDDIKSMNLTPNTKEENPLKIPLTPDQLSPELIEMLKGRDGVSIRGPKGEKGDSGIRGKDWDSNGTDKKFLEMIKLNRKQVVSLLLGFDIENGDDGNVLVYNKDSNDFSFASIE